ncbi:MAG: hypothetical protein K2L11_05895, partial [Muribaculaceae bacterium]|nr:hypothetical protein [Muribaculaceae bacterium]
RCDTLSIIGLAENPEDVVFAVNRGQTQGAVGNYTMFNFKGKSLTTRNITFGNYCNTDLVYPRNPSLNRKRRKDAIVQAQIGICDGTDRLFAENCRFISRLNLCPFVGARRSLYDNCYFECTDDALSGSAVYLDCRFTFFSSKPFYSTAETGAVFLNCDITCLGNGVQYFTKVPGQVTAIDTRFYCDNPIDIRWTRDASDVICRQENITLNGKPYIIDADRIELGPSLAGTSLRNAYKIDHEGNTIYNLPNLLNGTDAWDPKELNATIASIEAATGKKLTGLPVALRININKPEPLSDGSKVEIESTPLLWGAYPAGMTKKIDFLAENSLPEEKEIVVPIYSDDGLSARATFKVAPKLSRAPKLKSAPKIRFDAETGCFLADYSLSGKGVDDSMIMWGRVMSGDNGRKVYLIQEGNAPTGRYYKAKAGDLGYEIVAIVMPKFKDSYTGSMETSSLFAVTDPEQTSGFPESSLSTDFSGISVVERESGIPGLWSFDVYKPDDTSAADWVPADGPGWYFGNGFDASTGKGLVQSEKGARMSYVPARDVCDDMTVSLIAEPAKSGGQGFGSATSQYMDICVKFDPIDLDGYALRIERTPDHDRAVSFSLIRYDKGQTSVISEKVISDCFRNPCHISVGISDGVLKASAYTDAPVADRKCCDEVVDQVTLSAPVEANELCGFCIQHTGSTGPSSTLLRDLQINWK